MVIIITMILLFSIKQLECAILVTDTYVSHDFLLYILYGELILGLIAKVTIPIYILYTEKKCAKSSQLNY